MRKSFEHIGSAINQFAEPTKCLAIAALVLGGCSSFAASGRVAEKTPHARSGSGAPSVTPVTGESWLVHLHRPFAETSMGKTWRLGPAPADATLQHQAGLTPDVAPGALTSSGRDLYRLNCQGCHGEAGLGAPPEINSLINPVRASSSELVMHRMKNVGMEISRADAETLAQQAGAALLQRLRHGGEEMPTFSHLSDTEVRALVAYLRELVGVPGAEADQLAVTESATRVGELIVKSTCHTCHGAVGMNPGPQQLLEGAIPPLDVLTMRKNRPEFIHKVTSGATILMGSPPMPCRGRMAVFDYLSDVEISDVYLYLTRYPPLAEARTETPVTMSQTEKTSSASGTGPDGTSLFADGRESGQTESDLDPQADRWAVTLPPVVALLVVLLGGSLAIVLQEHKWHSVTADKHPGTRGFRLLPGKARPQTDRPAKIIDEALEEGDVA